MNPREYGNHSTNGANKNAMGVTTSFLNSTRHNDGVLFLSPDESMAGPSLIRQSSPPTCGSLSGFFHRGDPYENE
jgi:hypothetical protein